MGDELSRRSFFRRTVTIGGATLIVPFWLSGCEVVKETMDSLGIGGGGDKGKGKKKKTDDPDGDEGDGDKGKDGAGDGASASADGDDGDKGKGKGKDKGKKGDKAAEENDVVFLNKGVLMEQAALMTYAAAAGLDFIKKDKGIMAVAGLFMSQHEAHRDALLAAIKELGGTAVDPKEAKPPEIPKEILDEKAKKAARKIAVLKFARSRELDAASNYFLAATEVLQTAPARKLATNILPVEAQHVAVYDMVLEAEKPVGAALFTEEV
jgi:hypothetical protein